MLTLGGGLRIRFADAGDDDTAGGRKNGFNGLGEVVIDKVCQILDGFFFVGNDL